MLGRETALDKITWTADGWPIVNHLEGPSTLALKPDLPDYPFVLSDTDNGNFAKGLSHAWSWVRVPEADSYKIVDTSLLLRAGRAPLSTMYSRNILVRPQEAFCFTITASLRLDSEVLKYNGGEAGITCYYDENTYLTFHVVNKANHLYLKVSEHIDTTTTDAACIDLALTNRKVHTVSRHLSMRTVLTHPFSLMMTVNDICF